MSAALDSPLSPTTAPSFASDALLAEVKAFRADCLARYRFNNAWDVVLSTVGILLSIAIVAAGFLKRAEISAILGAIVGAVVTAQKAFPFGQRARFYRLLIGQADNLVTYVGESFWTKQQAIVALSSLRMDFAQELPRGTSNAQDADQSGQPKKVLPTVPSPVDGSDSDAVQASTHDLPESSSAAAEAALRDS